MSDKIILRTHKPKPASSELVRISAEASRVLNRLARRTGLSMSKIASQMIVQGEELVEILEDDEDDFVGDKNGIGAVFTDF